MLQRSPLTRKTALKRGCPLVRKAPLNSGGALPRVNRKRARTKHARNFDGGIDPDTFVRRQPCCLCVARGREPKARDIIQAAHVKPRGMGGCNSSWELLVPLCVECHEWQERRTVAAVYRETGIELYEVAAAMVFTSKEFW